MEGTGYPVNRKRTYGNKVNFTSPSEYMKPKRKTTSWTKLPSYKGSFSVTKKSK